jgi:signal transduction histidine kinase
VAAVRSYSQLDRSAKQPTDILGGLDSTLLILSHRLREGVTVTRDYRKPIPSIDAYAGELNQVWTNLIDNAIDAMDGRGTLRLSARADDQHVVVEITDSGPGLPAEIVDRVFDPFFTTKEVGKGTGLGLDIARRIVVDRHGGTIGIDSQPGNTVVRVRLPLAGAVL